MPWARFMMGTVGELEIRETTGAKNATTTLSFSNSHRKLSLKVRNYLAAVVTGHSLPA